jgi:hypothetical protein
MHACMFFFLPTIAFLVYGFFAKITLLSTLVCFQQAPNTDMWLLLSHLSFVHFVGLPSDNLELFLELCYLCLRLRGLLLECVYCLGCNFITDKSGALLLGLLYMSLGFLCLCKDFCYFLLEQFHLSLTLLFLCLRGGEFCLQFLHILCPFDALHDGHCLLPLLEALDSCAYHFFFLVPLLDLLIFL